MLVQFSTHIRKLKYFELITSNIMFSNSFLCASLFRVFFSAIFAGCCLVDLINLFYCTKDFIAAILHRRRHWCEEQ